MKLFIVTGVDVNHAKIAINCVARFHALGIAVKQKFPETFQRIKSKALLKGLLNATVVQQIYSLIVNTVRHSTTLLPYMPKLEAMIMNDSMKSLNQKDDSWSTVAHGDFRLNNLMFHKNYLGIVDDVKMYDFPLFTYHSGLIDLPYFLNTALDDYTYNEHFDDLIDYYYESFIETLNVMKCEIGMYTKQKFYEHLKDIMIARFGASLILIKVSTSEIGKSNKGNTSIDTVLEDSSCDTKFCKKVIKVIKKYEQHGWW